MLKFRSFGKRVTGQDGAYEMIEEPRILERQNMKSKDQSGAYEGAPGASNVADGIEEVGLRVYSSWWERYITSYRAGLLRSALIAGFVFALNVALDGWMFQKFGAEGGSGVLLRSSCRAVHAADIVVHLVLNVLSTLILGASNYCMQALCAPTRAEIDVAHAQRRWADIGTQSLRNLRLISKGRLSLWALLAVSSIPLHLL
jgi:hypothetical protein